MSAAERARRLVRAWRPAVDVALAVVFVAAVAVERANEPARSLPTTVLSAALTLTMAGSLVARRRSPMAAYLTSTVALCLEAALQLASPISPYANLLGVYSFGLYASRDRARWGPPMIAVATGIYFLGTSRATGTVPLDGIGVLIVWLATWTVGYQTARRRDEQRIARQAIRRQVVAVTRDLIRQYLGGARDDPAARRALDHLTHREREVLALIGQGLSNHEIGDRLVIAESTAKTYVKRILAKIGARDRAQAVVFAYHSGLVSRFD